MKKKKNLMLSQNTLNLMKRVTVISLLFLPMASCTIGNLNLSSDIKDVNLGDEVGTTTTSEGQKVTVTQASFQMLQKGFKMGQKQALEMREEIVKEIIHPPPGRAYRTVCDVYAAQNLDTPKAKDFLFNNPKVAQTRDSFQWVASVAWNIRKNYRYYETYRSLEKQREKVRQGRSQTLKSRHLARMAGDIYICKGSDCKADWKAYTQYGAAAGVFATVTTILREESGCKWYSDNAIDWKTIHDPGHHAIYDHPRFDADKSDDKQIPRNRI